MTGTCVNAFTLTFFDTGCNQRFYRIARRVVFLQRVVMGKTFQKAVVAGALCVAALGRGQTPASKPEFEVASIKPAQPLQSQVAAGKLHVGMTIDGARVDIGS